MRIHKACECSPIVCVRILKVSDLGTSICAHTWGLCTHTSSMDTHTLYMRTHTYPNPNLENRNKPEQKLKTKNLTCLKTEKLYKPRLNKHVIPYSNKKNKNQNKKILRKEKKKV